VILNAKRYVSDTKLEALYVKSRHPPWLDMKKKRIYNAHDVF